MAAAVVAVVLADVAGVVVARPLALASLVASTSAAMALVAREWQHALLGSVLVAACTIEPLFDRSAGCCIGAASRCRGTHARIATRGSHWHSLGTHAVTP
jgi:hypothetical protein